MTTQKTTPNPGSGVRGLIFSIVPAPRWGAKYWNGSFEYSKQLVCWAAVVNEAQDSSEIVGMVINDENETVPARSIEGFISYVEHF